jgi:hypothetical protein
VSKAIQFSWLTDKPEFLIEAGRYNWTLELWTEEDRDKPSIRVPRILPVSETMAATLSDRRQKNSNRAWDVTFETEPTPNSVSQKAESKSWWSRFWRFWRT